MARGREEWDEEAAEAAAGLGVAAGLDFFGAGVVCGALPGMSAWALPLLKELRDE